MQIRRLGNVRTILGEGPYWDVQDQVLFFVDIRGMKIWRFDPADESFISWDTPVQPSAISRTVDGGFVTSMADGFYNFDPATGAFEPIAKPGIDTDKVQINDAKVDRQGRFVSAGLDKVAKEPLGDVYSFDGRVVRTIDRGYVTSNGPCWSPDGRTFYLADTLPANIVYAYDYDTETGSVSNKRVFAECSEIGGYADGATVDAEGRLWMAFCGGGNIACFNDDGSIHRVVPTDIKWVSSVQFGGPDLDRLYVISLDPKAAADYPPDDQSGYLYVIEGLGVKGLPEPLALAPDKAA